MAILTLPRDPATSDLLLPGLRSTLRTDFLLDTALPSWLTTSSASAAVSTIASGQGDLVLVTAATANAKATLSGPSVDLSKVEAILWEVDGLGTSVTTDTIGLTIGIGGSANVGGQATWAVAATTGTAGVAGSTGTAVVPHNAVAVGEAGRRRNLAVLILPKRKHLYVLLGDQVLTDADLPGMVAGVAKPYVEITTSTAVAVALLVSRARVTVWKSTDRVAATVGSPLAGSAPTAMTLTAIPGNGQITVNRTGGEGSGVSYALYRGTTVTGSPIATSFPYTDTGLTNGTAVSYIATATNATGTVTTPVVSATPVAGPVTLVADNFTAADGTPITGRAAPDGTSTPAWTVDGVGGMTIQGNAAIPGVTTSPGTTFQLLDAGVRTYRIRATVKALLPSTANRKHALLFRYQATTDYMRVGTNTGVYLLTKIIGGTATNLVTTAIVPAVGDVVEVTVNETTGVLTLFVNGTNRGTATDNALATATKFGLSSSYTTTGTGVTQDPTSAWDDIAVFSS